MFDYTKPLDQLSESEVTRELAKHVVRCAELDAADAEHERMVKPSPPPTGIWPGWSNAPPAPLPADVRLEDWERQEYEGRNCDLISSSLIPALRKELMAEREAAKITEADRQNWARFRDCCKRYGVPNLPAPAESIAIFLAEESQGNTAATLETMLASIAAIHLALNEPNHSTSILVRALLRACRDEDATKANELQPTER